MTASGKCLMPLPGPGWTSRASRLRQVFCCEAGWIHPLTPEVGTLSGCMDLVLFHLCPSPFTQYRGCETH